MKKKIVKYEEVTISEELRNNCIEYLKDNPLEMYWDYRDKFSLEDCQKIIDGKLWEVEENIWEWNLDYICDLEYQLLDNMKQEFPELEDFDVVDLRDEFLDYLGCNMNIEQLLNNTTVRMRIVLHSNYEGYLALEGEGLESDYFKELYPLLKGKVDEKSLKQEINNSMYCSQFIFYGSVNMGDIYKYDFENWKEITIKPDCMAGLFDSWNGSGSILETKIIKPITLKKQWGSTKYDSVSILIDEAKKYSVEETYGLCNVPDLKFELK